MSAARRVIAVVGLAALIGVLLWALLRTRDHESARDDGPAVSPPASDAPSTLDATPVAPQPRVTASTAIDAVGATASAAKGALVVLGDDGKPVVGATVHARRKIATEDDRLRAVGTTDADGRWPVATALAGEWIAVTSLGRVPAFLDGDRVDASGDTVIRLAPGGVVEATVVEADDRTPVADAIVFVHSTRENGDDDETAGLSLWERGSLVNAGAETGDDGRAVLRVGIAGPVHVEVRPSNWNLYVDPPSVDLPQSSGSVRFRVLAGCMLAVHAIDDATGMPLAVPFEVRHGPAATPEQFVGGFTTNPDKTGIFDLFPGLKPGRYVLRVGADGYEPWTSEPVVLDAPGASAVVEARVKRAASPRWGSIRLTLLKPAHDGAAWYERTGGGERGPTLVLRRTSPSPTKWGGPVPRLNADTIRSDAIRGETKWDAERRVLEISDVEPARYAIAIFDRSTWMVGGVADLEVLPDAATERVVDLVPGVRVPIAALKKDAKDAASSRAVRLFDERGTEWPAVVLGYGSMVTYDSESRIPAGVVLDPVPAARVRVTWRDAGGTERETWFP